MPESVTVVLAMRDPISRRRTRGLLEAQPGVTVVAECASGVETVDSICAHSPSVVLLDAGMPDLDALAIVERVGAYEMPAVIFLTRLDRGLLRKLELHGLSYLLESFDDRRLVDVFRRAVRQTEPRAQAGVRRRLARLLAGDEVGSMERRIPVRSAGRTQYVELDDVRWVEGAGAFSRLHLDDRTHVVKATLDELADRFPDGFVRIHSTLVRTSEVAEIQRGDGGVALVTLRDGRHLRVSERSGPEIVAAG